MSLIEEALRRVQDPALSQAQKSQKATTQVKPPAEKSPAHSWPTTAPSPLAGPTASAPSTRALSAVALVIVALTTALIIGGVWWLNRATRALGPSASPSTAPGSLISTRLAGEPSPSLTTTAEFPALAAARTAPVPSAPGGFVLSGVVEGLGESYAVINGMVVRPGDGIEDATVLRIGDGSVTLRRPDGTNLVLRVSP